MCNYSNVIDSNALLQKVGSIYNLADSMLQMNSAVVLFSSADNDSVS